MSSSNTSNYNTPTFAPFQSGCSKCYPSTDFVQQNGGNQSLISSKAGKNYFKTPDFNVPMKTLVKNNSGKSYNTSAGGSKKKSNSNIRMRGGNDSDKMKDFLNQIMDKKNMISEEMMGGVKKAKKEKKTKDVSKKSSSKKPTSKKPISKKPTSKKSVSKKKGGALEGASLDVDMNGMPVNAKFPENSQFGMPTGVGTQMAVNNGSDNDILKTLKANPLSEGMEDRLNAMGISGGAKKPKKSKKSKKMKGGEETWGATGMPQQFYDPNIPMADYPSNSGDGMKTAYGKIQASDVGTGMLAPYTASKSKTANHATMMKTGGGLIPSMNTGSVRNVSSTVDKGYKAIETFFKKLEKNYNNSVQKTKNIKIGNQRLVQGGTKDKKAKKSKKNKKGGDGSDWSMTANSRGPSNAPDTVLGVDGEKWFRQFNKTGEYIRNSDLAKAAAPKLTGGPVVTKVMGYSPFEDTYGSVSGGAKKTTTKKTATKKTVTKKTATKKPVTKKTATKKTTTKKPATKKTATKKSTTKK